MCWQTVRWLVDNERSGGSIRSICRQPSDPGEVSPEGGTGRIGGRIGVEGEMKMTTGMPRSQVWKQTERFVADLLGGKRVPITGRQRGDVPDIEHPRYSVEVKRRSAPNAFPKWLTTALEQADAANPGGKVPIVVIEHAHGAGRMRDHYVMLRLPDFIDLTTPPEDA